MKSGKTGFVMLVVVAILYGVLFVSDSDKTFAALKESAKVLVTILPILLVVLVLTALFNTFVDAETIAEHLGEESGTKGWAVALLGGILSHGPGYVWYPLLQNLRERGAKDGLVVAFIYARAIKLPWLPLMIAYFGWAFSASYTFWVVVGAWLQGVMAQRLLKRSKSL